MTNSIVEMIGVTFFLRSTRGRFGTREKAAARKTPFFGRWVPRNLASGIATVRRYPDAE